MLRIELLGPLRILVQGRPLPANVWDRRNTRSLLGLLLTDPGKSFSFDEVMEAVWPHLDPDAAAKSLRAAVSKLRKVLEPDLPQGRLSKYIRTDQMGYSFTVPPHCILDVDEANRTLQEGKKFHDQERWNEALTHYQKILSIYRGDFLADEPESVWLFPYREHWREVRYDTLLAKSKCHLSLGQYSYAIEDCRTLLEKNRSHEAAYRNLMLCHYLSGRLNDVAVLFKQCREALQSELGVEPSEETVRLYDQILRRRVPGIDKTVRSPVTVRRSQRVPHSLGRLQFIGREKEIGLLASHVKAALQKEGSIVAIGGEPGIGKTRLAEEILVYAKAGGVLTAGGRCYSPALRRPYEPFAEILRQILKGPGRERMLSLSPFWLSCVTRIVPELPLPDGTPAIPSIAVEQEKHRLFEALSRLMIDLTEQTPLALLLDDLHWADDETLEALHHLARQISRERILILVTYHPEKVSSHPLLTQFFSEIQRVSSRTMVLSLLTGRSLIELFQKMSAKGESPERMERLALRIFDETQGNPLFVVELLQTLLEKGILKVNPRGKWIASKGGDEGVESSAWEIPNGIRQVILSRLERVPPVYRSCLGILSTLDRGFTKDLLEKLIAPEGTEVTGALDELLRLGFLQGDPDLKGVYRFAHENVRKTVYDRLRFREKKEFHFRAARALESAVSSDTGAQELAHHFALAEQWPKTFKYLTAAAEDTHRTYAYDTALYFLDQAEQILNVHGPAFMDSERIVRRRLQILNHKQGILCEQGQTKKRQKVVEEMVRLACKLGDPVELAGTKLVLACLLGAKREWPRAIDLAEQALTLYRDRNEKEGMARAFRELGYSYWQSELLKQALEANQRALQLHEAIGNAKGVAGDLHNLGQVYTSMGDYEKGLEYYRKARTEFQKIGERAEESRTLNILSRISRLTGNLTEALSSVLEAIALDRETGDRHGELLYLMDAASLSLALGNSAEALTFYESALQTARTMGGNTGKEGHALRGMGIIHEQQGNIDRAAACFTESAALLSESGDFPSWAEVCRRLGDLMNRHFRRRDKALHYYGAALAYYRKEGPVDAVRPLLNQMGYTCWENGKPEEAIPYYLESLHLAREKGKLAAEGGALAAISVVYRETGRLEASLDAGLRALAAARSLKDGLAERYVLSSLCDTYLALEKYPEAEKTARTSLKQGSRPASGDRIDEARIHYRLAKALRKRGKKSESRVHLNKALTLAEKSGDQEFLNQIALMQKGEPCPSS